MKLRYLGHSDERRFDRYRRTIMKTTRRGFFKTAGLGTAAGLIGGTTLLTPGAFAQSRHAR
ncbi:MAG TPA: hypothetical protein DEB59_11880, partial [Acidimicrobiaceae bacterium]|nr:hypothetical protein [Acidimicrobiaceae bacterium]